MVYIDLPERSPRFVAAGQGIRMTCECCGYPTLPLVPYNDWAEVDWESSGLACLLCGWENAPARLDGTPDPDAPSAEERNGGYDLETARANFRRHAWMYDPARPEPWMGGPPPASELALRRELGAAYAELAAAPEPHRDWRGWEAILAREAALRAAEAARSRSVEERWDEGLADGAI